MCVWNFRTLKLASTQIETDINVNFNGFVVLSYVQGVSEKISRILKQQKVKVAYKSQQTINSLFPRPI